MNKYKKAKIYRIVSNITGENYYGSTCEPTLARRLSKHRSNYNDFKNGKGNYITSFKILETEDYDIVLVENLENCQSKDELHKRERYHIENNECVNKVIPTRPRQETQKVYYNKHKDIINKRNKIYATTHQNEIKEYKKRWQEENKQEISAKRKEYCEKNKEKVQQSQKLSFEKNKETILAKRNEIVECECGNSYRRSNKHRHIKTKLHLSYANKSSQ